MSFNWTQIIPGVGHEYSHIATAGIVSTALIASSVAAKVALGSGQHSVIPAGQFSLRSLFEMCTEFIVGLVDMVIGHHGRNYIPMFSAVFTFVFVNNLVGVLPGMSPATENINTSLGMGVFMFLFYNFEGLRVNGMGYVKHLFGPVIFLAPLMFVIELVSHIVRPASLGLRLANVMGGDHKVVGIFLDLVPIGIPIPFYLMGLFVCFVQAFVFTLLSMVYVALATAHDEH